MTITTWRVEPKYDARRVAWPTLRGKLSFSTSKSRLTRLWDEPAP
jgi:hypothetical protein